MSPQEKLAKILRTDKDYISKVDRRLSEVTGNKGVMEYIIVENETQIRERLLRLGVAREDSAKAVYDALISKIEADDHKLFEVLGNPMSDCKEDCERVLNLASKLVGPQRGFFLKTERAKELLLREPPKKILEYLKYGSVEEMLAKEDVFEIFSALRFLEGNEWLNNVFFKQYEHLTPYDFEERDVIVRALDERWKASAEEFVKKKWHNISHLKELGVVFVLPIALNISGEILRMLSLIMHYLHEVPFYADMVKRCAETPTTFAANLISLLRGDVENRRIEEGNKSVWLVVQRYLAKDDENDWRLFVPRINPEALHWQKAEEDLTKIGKIFSGFNHDLHFWHNLDWVGDFFKDEVGNNVLVSFDLVDTVMSLVQEKEMIKYLYHHQEALWNKIFTEYFSRDELEKFSKDYLLQGYFEI